MPTPICSIEGCEGGARARGWCSTHYSRWRRHGDPLEAPYLSAIPGRVCEWCSGPIPPTMRPNTVFCSRRCRESRPEVLQVRKDWHRRSRYGLSKADFDRILAEQGGACASCGDSSPGGKHGWHVDHDHETGAIRGVLCHKCNVGLGMFRDDPVLLAAAIRYLARWG